jgi:hypothetical protein
MNEQERWRTAKVAGKRFIEALIDVRLLSESSEHYRALTDQVVPLIDLLVHLDDSKEKIMARLDELGTFK